MRFRTTIELGGRTATGFSVPAEIVAALGRGKRPPVRVTIGRHTYRSTVAAYGETFMLPLAAEHREAAGVAAGDEIEVEVQLDTAPREVVVPADLATALDEAPDARALFDALSYSDRRRIVLAVEGAKASETRERRIRASVERLRSGAA